MVMGVMNSESSFIEWPWLARMSQSEKAVVSVEREGLVSGLGLMAKRFFSLVSMTCLSSGKVMLRFLRGPHVSWIKKVSQYIAKRNIYDY